MDDDQVTRAQWTEAQKLWRGIRQHYYSRDENFAGIIPALGRSLPEWTDPLSVVPDWPEFQRCLKYRQSRASSRLGRKREARRRGRYCLQHQPKTLRPAIYTSSMDWSVSRTKLN